MFKKILILLSIFSFFGFLLFYPFFPGEQPSQASSASNVTVQESPRPVALDAEKLWDEVQEYREKNRLPLYKKESELCEIARSRIDQVKKNWSHSDFYATNWYKDHPNIYQLSENLAANQINEVETLLDWLNSPTHKKNLHDSFTHSCIVTEGGYAVQIFARY